MPFVPYAGDVCKKGCEAPPLVRAGRYAGLCQSCKDEAVAEARENGSLAGRPKRDEALTAACKSLTKHATRLESALASRKAAQIKARSELALFKEALEIVGRVARSMVNTSQPPADAEQDA